MQALPVVLVVDDDDLIRRALAQSLARLGCTVLQAPDGEQALDVAARAHPAAIFLDLRMPRLDGHAVLRRLPARGITSPVVVMSGHGHMDDVIDAMRNGAIDYLRKPWSATDLVAALGRALEIHRALDGAVASEVAAELSRPSELAAAGRVPSATVARLKRLAVDPTASADLVAEVIASDGRLASAVLALANAWRGTQAGMNRAVGGREAVALLGAVHTYALAAALGVRDACAARAAAYRTLQDHVWRFSVARAIAMHAVAEVTGPGLAVDPGRCSIAGLLLDVGALFLLGQTAAGDPEAGGAPPDLPMPRLIPVQHPAASQALLTEWGLPGALASLALTHHAETVPLSDDPMWCVAVVGGIMAARLTGLPDPSSATAPRADLVDPCR